MKVKSMPIIPPLDLVQLSNLIGARTPIWTQGFGGNLSEKVDDEVMWIKASGKSLASIDGSGNGLTSSRFRELRAHLIRLPAQAENSESAYAEAVVASASGSKPSGRPSMETGFHAILPGRWVMHFHSLPGVLMAEEFFSKDTDLESQIGLKGLKVRFLPAVCPGWSLTQEILSGPLADIYVLRNHGVIVQTNEKKSLEKWLAIEKAYCADRGYKRLAVLLGAENPVALALAHVKTMKAKSLKLYFPDSAVLIDRLRAVLVKSESGCCLTENAWTSDSDAAELWLATALLQDACPELAELPIEISSIVAGLPAERFRMLAARG